MREVLENEANLRFLQAEVAELILTGTNGSRRVEGVLLKDGRTVHAGAVIVTTGTFLNGLAHIGRMTYSCGRNGEAPSQDLGDHLRRLDLNWMRLKTGTPPRLDGRTIRWEAFEPSRAMPIPRRSPSSPAHRPAADPLPYRLHHRGNTPHHSGQHPALAALQRPDHRGRPALLPLDRGQDRQVPRQAAHQIFLEPEGLDTHEVYVNGMSTSLPHDVQAAMVASIPGPRGG
jgi:tRNA uridine 5-carboxymethylaminomethyl modification enzyme